MISKIVERLAFEGYFVYAGARKAKDIAALSAIENIQGVRLDVTIQSEIDAAVDTISAGNRGLCGHPFSFSRDELVMMLDEALPRSADN